MNFFTKVIISEYNNDITELVISNKNIKGLLDLSKFNNLKKLDCSNNLITEIINFPNTLEILLCYNNKIKSFDVKNYSLCLFLYNKIYPMSILPHNLKQFNCSNNNVELFNYLPINLEILDCSFNNIKSLNNLPKLIEINCSFNKIKELDLLPLSLKILYCDNNEIKNFNNLPKELDIISGLKNQNI